MRPNIGDKFGMLTIVGFLPAEGKNGFCVARCDCKVERKFRTGHLKTGNTVSCGCASNRIQIEKRTKHGQHITPENRVWRSMRGRCNNPNDKKYYLYGGRGIKVAPEWDDFVTFLRDMGPRPPRATIDRIDANGNYEPGNCRWATYAEQSRNMRHNRWVVVHGEWMVVQDATRHLGINSGAAHWRAKAHGITLQEAIDYYAAKAAA